MLHSARRTVLAVPQHPAGDLAILGHLQRLLVEGVVALGEGAPQLPVLRQLPRRERHSLLTMTESSLTPKGLHVKYDVKCL